MDRHMEVWQFVGFIVLFPLLWCGVSFLLAHLGGWSRLATRYGTDDKPEGKGFYLQGGRIGWVTYSACLTIHVAERGMYMAVLPPFRIGHRLLFIPWAEFHDVREKPSVFHRRVGAAVGSPLVARVSLPARVFPPRRLRSGR